MSKTNAIDPNVPAGSENPRLGDDRIRALAAAVIEALAVDHYVGSDGGSGVGYNEDAAGEHAKVTIRNGSAPTAATGKGFLYVVSGELYYKDPSGNAIQLTTGGILNSLNLTGNQTAAGVKTFSGQASFAAGLTAAAALVSTLATGTAPFTVASTTKVSNLNADKVDGYDVDPFSGGESQTILGGRIVKGGYKARSGSTTTITFATPFPNGVVYPKVIAFAASPAGKDTLSPIVSVFNKTTLAIYSGNSVDGFYWEAVGY